MASDSSPEHKDTSAQPAHTIAISSPDEDTSAQPAHTTEISSPDEDISAQPADTIETSSPNGDISAQPAHTIAISSPARDISAQPADTIETSSPNGDTSAQPAHTIAISSPARDISVQLADSTAICSAYVIVFPYAWGYVDNVYRILDVWQVRYRKDGFRVIVVGLSEKGLSNLEDCNDAWTLLQVILAGIYPRVTDAFILDSSGVQIRHLRRQVL
ncbi:uncharacterized protein MAM_00963 [Metarhizium album ARSEF 1941]|uniref:Uncharacterized protein n=1 Tax=Metarhizium album (strain ARSEF 1941) TaxID=1081103 RepID=A0A0B2X097_METAS|nr:uncharacterized protein MAM_00963 [Metarhizium album ARSEF 1941]KHO01962.1 hypothetical protein MAM_00963 [Metarhizium album ARSEF 1941]